MEMLSAIWLPIVVMLFALAIGGLSWFFFVRSIEIPWDERNKKSRPQSQRPESSAGVREQS
ncbi:hypothetical protein [Rubinisphaera margarita]|uniref:hypothetical protein n=1 Tax=Rubinisphaera margarita TaxID=2909586 RepID=UPI001EE873D8|nr:hypothetical protein [Rubinisphaera margarita]MCG6155687.1 hypothetical protein [Rubinisphaera margarita]